MSKIEVNEIVNQSGDNDSGTDLSTNDQIGFKIANASKWTLNSSGNLFPASTLQGIVLGATSDTASNRLDDYEYGTFDSTVTSDTTLSDTTPDETLTHTGNSYVKVGQMCYVAMKRMDRTNTFSGNNVIITSMTLPFTAVDVTNNIYGASGHYQYYITGQYSSSTRTDGYIQTYVGSGGVSIVTLSVTNLNDGGYFLRMNSSVSNIYISFCYRTSA